MKLKYFLNLLKSLNPEKNKPFHAKKAVLIEMLEKVISGEKLNTIDEYKLVQCMNVSALTGKLEEFYSISSCVTENDICRHRANDCNSICHDCYAMQSVSYRTNLELSLLVNHIVLNCFDISVAAWRTLAIPSVNGKARLESHGDVASVQASDNMAKIQLSHDHLTFGVWTKNFGFWYQTFKKYGKPANMIFLVSSDKKNKIVELPEYIKPYVDHIFTVYDFETVKAKNINVQCGYHHCKDCMRCYTKGNTEFYINEILKKDTKKYKKYMGIE